MDDPFSALVGRWKIQLQALAAAAGYNLMRLAKDAEA